MLNTILKNTKMKKAQMKMGENIAILLIFFIIMGIVIIFYGAFKIGDIQETQREQYEKEAIRVALVATYLPELACTDDNHIVENCFDLEKVLILADLVNSTDDYLLLYQSEFKYSKISFDIIYPQKVEDIIIYDRPAANFTDMIPTYIPVSIRDPKAPFGQQYSFGMLEVGVYR